ncbi:MAG: SH3 domain-containing protein [Lachnospiraceae bacterium]
MNHWKRKTAGAVLAGTVAALLVSGPVFGENTSALSKLSAAGAASGLVSDIPETGRLLLPSCGVQYALAAKKVSLRDVKSAAGETSQDAETAQTGESDSAAAETAAPASVGAAVLYTASSAETSQASSETTDTTSTEAAQETTDTAASTESAPEEAADTATQSAVSVQPAESGDVILDTSLTPTQQKEQDLVLNEGAVAEVDVSRATELVAAAGQQADASSSESAAAGDTAAVADTASADTASETADSSLVVSTAADYVNIRKEPSEDAEIVGKLYAKSVGTVIAPADANGWVEITSGSVTGYVRSDYVATGSTAKELADAVGTQNAVVTTETLRVRAAASEDSDVISLIGQGQTYEILGEENGWYKVNTDDGEGYISADFADVEVQYPEAVSIAEEKAQEAAKKAEEAQKQSEAEQAAKAQSAAKGQQVVDYAMQFLGNPYVWGGSSLTNGTDCSGFTMAVYAHFGVSLPHYDASQRSCGTAVSSLSAAQPGDLICYYGHVGIYIGNGQIISASNPRSGIKISSATYRQIAAIRRIFN